jgi:hypothetical protein
MSFAYHALFGGRGRHWIAFGAALALGAGLSLLPIDGSAPAWATEPPPRPLLAKGKPVDWWFVFKFGAAKPFAGCGNVPGDRPCPFGGEPLTRGAFGQQFVFASSADPKLIQGTGCLGAQTTDPVGATFDEVYNGSYFFVLWNDQFYGDPRVCGRSANCTGRWGHSKGLLAWNEEGEGFIMQVSTPSWPGSGTSRVRRASGNTLGCVKTNNNLIASQHFFALRLNRTDLVKVLQALQTASVATDPNNAQVVFNGGPKEVRDLVFTLGRKPSVADKFPFRREELSTRVNNKPVILIAKPSNLNVPPWQMVSALLKGVPTRAATWWTRPKIPSTSESTQIRCWSHDLRAKPGPVAIALTGEWKASTIKLYAPSNHAKIGIAASADERYEIFGDLNQQGSLSPPRDCDSSQNGRGGIFFVTSQ